MKTQCVLVFVLVQILMVACPAGAASDDLTSFQGIRYVDDDAPGPVYNGSSWQTAFRYLQDALGPAQSGQTIRVAQGIYMPDQGNGATPGDRQATFQLKNGVTLRGGYAGWGAPDPNARDIQGHETILSGDLNGNDVETIDPCDLVREPTRAENSYHVVTSSATEPNAVLDGFTIRSGHATKAWGSDLPDDHGGGMYNDYGSPTIRNCSFRENTAYRGGGIYNYSGSPTIINCSFIMNRGGENGGGMYNNEVCNPTVTNCRFMGNYARATTAGFGGGMHNNWRSSPVVTNCSFSGNTAWSQGGGMFNYNNNPTVTNCSFCQNRAIRYSAGGIYNYYQGRAYLKNCILWGNEPDEISNFQSTTTVTYSNVQGGWPGVGNLNADPLFVDPDGSDDIVGTEDDDLRLLPGSPCIDAGDNSAVPADVTTDLEGLPRFIDDPGTMDTGKGTAPIVDMGAHEGLVTICDTYPASPTISIGIGAILDSTGIEMANQFTVEDATYKLRRVTVTVFRDDQDGGVTLHLYTDRGDIPGTEIATWGPYSSFTNSPGSDIVVDMSSGPLLHADTKYWLAMSAVPVGAGPFFWRQSSLTISGYEATRTRENPAWSVFALPIGDSHMAAMRLDGIPQ